MTGQGALRWADTAFSSVIKPPYVRGRRLLRRVLFDRRYRVDTDGVVGVDQLGFSDPRFVYYQPAGLWDLRRILRPREVSEDDVFVDFGSGKGRVVLQAALHYPFRRVYGVELSEQLHEIAQRNVERTRGRFRCRDVRLVSADVRDFEIPDDVTIAFFYNPFVGEVFDSVITRLLESFDRRPRPLRIIYGNPREEEALLRTGRIRPVRTLRGWRPGREWSRSNSYRMYAVS